MKMLCTVKLSPHRYKTPEGYLICKDCIIARTGKQTYLKSELYGVVEGDDDYIDVDRKPEEVFSEKTMASFEGKPLTIEHPDDSVTPDNYKELSVGNVHNVRKGEFEGQDVMFADINVYDSKAIELIESGDMVELSCGYDCDITDGPNPQQINIRGNHVALCEQGRAGIARIQDAAKAKLDPRIDAIVSYHYRTDFFNDLDMTGFINRLMMEYLPNDLSRQPTKEEKEYAKAKAKKMMSEKWGVKPVAKDSGSPADVEMARKAEQAMDEIVSDPSSLHLMTPGELGKLKEQLKKKLYDEGIDLSYKTVTSPIHHIPFFGGNPGGMVNDYVRHMCDKSWKKLPQHEEAVAEAIKNAPTAFKGTPGYGSEETDKDYLLSRTPGSSFRQQGYGSASSTIETNNTFYVDDLGNVLVSVSTITWDSKISDSVQKGTLIQEFGRYGEQYKIVKIVGNVLYCEEITTHKNTLFKKDKENVDWAIITKADVNDAVSKNWDLVRSKKKHYTIDLRPHGINYSPDYGGEVTGFIVTGEIDYEFSDNVYDNAQEALADAKKLYERYKSKNEIDDNSYTYYVINVTEWSEGGGTHIDPNGKDIGSMWTFDTYDKNELPEKFIEAEKRMYGTADSLKGKFAIALPEDSWLDEEDKPTKDKSKARRFETEEEAKEHRDTYCNGEVKAIKDAAPLKLEANRIADLIKDLSFSEIAYFQDTDTLEISFDNRATMRKAAKILSKEYDIELSEDMPEGSIITIYEKLGKGEKKDSLRCRMVKGRPSEDLKKYLKDRKIDFKEIERKDSVSFEISDPRGVAQEIKTINSYYAKTGLYDDYSKKFYVKAIKALNAKLDKLEKNELLDSNQEDYSKQKQSMKEEILAQIKEYTDKLNGSL